METTLNSNKEVWGQLFSVLAPIKDSVVKGRSSEELYVLYERIVEHNKISEKEFLLSLEERKLKRKIIKLWE